MLGGIDNHRLLVTSRTGAEGQIADSGHRSMRRRSGLTVTFVALLAVGWNVVTTQPSGSALAADPAAQLAETRAQLADARSAQRSLAAALDRQRSELATL